MASGIAWRLYRAGFRNISMLEIANPLAVRRTVCFCEAVYDSRTTVDGIEAILTTNDQEMDTALAGKKIPVVVDPEWTTIARRKPQVVIDAILAKKNLGTRIDEADLVIGLGPGFVAGEDVDVVVETNRGPNGGRLLYRGSAEKNTGVPGKVMGIDRDRVLRAPAGGLFLEALTIGDSVKAGETVGHVGKVAVKASTSGIVRGLIRDGITVGEYLKIGDIEPRDNVDIALVSDKSLGLGGAVLEAVMAKFNI